MSLILTIFPDWLTLYIVQVERAFDQFSGSKDGDPVVNPIKDNFKMEKPMVERIEYFMDLISCMKKTQWKKIMESANGIISATETAGNSSLSSSVRAPDNDQEIKAARAKRRKIAALDSEIRMDGAYNSADDCE